jgi:stage II sporulation protein AA (anti-sigma F factor antagonist)
MSEVLVQIDSRLESGSVPAFQQRLTDASPLGTEKLLLDLSRVSFIGSAALRAVLVTAKRLGAAGGRLAIFAPPHIAEVFNVSGLDSVVPVSLSLELAREALGG